MWQPPSRSYQMDSYESLLSLYSLLKKECTKENFNMHLLQSLAEECLLRVTRICDEDAKSTRAPVLELLKKSMEHIHQSLIRYTTEGPIVSNAAEYVNSMDFEQKSEMEESSIKSRSYTDEVATMDEKQLSTRKSAVEDTIIKSCDVTFDDVIGLEEAKRTLQEAIVIPTLFPQLFTGNRQPWRRILLYGPPGTGKSRLAMAVAGHIKTTFYSVSGSDMLSCWFGESEKLIRDLFSHSRSRKGPAVIFMDEIDGLCRRRNSTEQEATRRIKTELLLQMDNMTNCGDGNDKQTHNDVIIICATNSPWEIDPAFLRRFQKRIYIPLPDLDSRVAILKLHCNKTECSVTDEEWRKLGEKTAGFSGSDLATLANSALFEPIRDLENATHFTATTDKTYRHCSPDEPNAIKCRLIDIPRFLVLARNLEFHDFEKGLLTNTTTVTKEDLENFEQFTVKFGQLGK